MNPHDLIAKYVFGWNVTENMWVADTTALTPFRWNSRKAQNLLVDRLAECGVTVEEVVPGMFTTSVLFSGPVSGWVTAVSEGDALMIAALRLAEELHP